MRHNLLVVIVSGMTMTSIAAVYFRLGALLLLPSAFIAVGAALALAARPSDQA